MGIAVLRSEIANSIQQNFGLQLEPSDVEQVLMHEPTVLDKQVVDEVHRMLRSHTLILHRAWLAKPAPICQDRDKK